MFETHLFSVFPLWQNVYSYFDIFRPIMTKINTIIFCIWIFQLLVIYHEISMSYSNTHYEAHINTYSHIPHMYIHAQTVFFISSNSPLLLLILNYSYKKQHFFQFIKSSFSSIKVTFEIFSSIRRACLVEVFED